MKRMKFLLVACLLGIAATASAQFVNSGSSSSAGSTTGDVWEGLRVSYMPMTMVYDVTGAEDTDLTGFSLGYVKSFGVSSTAPLFVETGLNLSYATYSEEKEEGKYYSAEVKLNMMSLTAPVNLVYKYALSEEVSILPYAGVYLRGNLFGKYKTETSYDGETESTKLDLFDEKDMGKDGVYKRLQLGWQIGVGLHYNNIALRLSYGKDFSEIAKKTKVATTTMSVGLNF